QEAWFRGSAGYDNIRATGLDDTIVGNGGDDYLQGYGGSDTYRYASGDGADEIVDNGNASDVDLLKLTNLNAADVALRRDGDSLLIKDNTTGQEIRVTSQFASDESVGIEQIAFTDGTTWDRDRIRQEAWFRGSAGYDNIRATGLDDTIVGNGGDDYLQGYGGTDTYLYASGDGADQIVDQGNSSDIDVLKLTNLNAADVALRRDGDSLFVKDNTTGQEIWVASQFASDGTFGVEQIAFADGTTWDRAQMWQEAWIQGSAGYDNIRGTGLDDTIVGNGGDDYLQGYGGSDTYRYASGDGADQIVDQGNASDIDVLKLTNLNATDVALRREGESLFVKDNATGQEIWVASQFASDGTFGIEQIAFADGTVWDGSDIAVRVSSPGTFSQEQYEALISADRLIQASSAFGTQASSEITLSSDANRASELHQWAFVSHG
ncbi:calcium-binding protein, partial [Sphingomonas sp. DT-204]|uniref:calcium-binding protein n=1 Tax=Sphingomonas sp. DT-204 TaxID=3396166 RepID=UPI003F194430